MTWLIPVGILLLVGAWLGGAYNGLVGLRNQVQNAWAQIDVQLKRRHDLIPNLVEAVTGYTEHERETLDLVTRARYEAMQATGIPAQGAAENALSGALGKLMLIAEDHPDLKANQNFLSLQEELSSTEDQVSLARQLYNDAVMNYNTRIETIPNNLISGMLGFPRNDFFETTSPQEREVPKVGFKS